MPRYLEDQNVFKAVMDYLIAPASVLGTIAGYLPLIAAGLGVVWYGIQIYDRLVYGPKREKSDD